MEDLKTEDESTRADSLPKKEKERKDISVPLTPITNLTDQLDIVLTILNDNEQRPHTINDIFNDKYFRENKSYILHKDLILAVEKLCDDKHVSLIVDFDGRTPAEKYIDIPVPDKSYRITYLGRLFLNNTWRIYNRRPYREGQIINKLTTIWIIIKATSSAAITITVVIIGILGLMISDKTDKLQQKIDDQTKAIETQNFKIDSLIKVTNDTTRLKKK